MWKEQKMGILFILLIIYYLECEKSNLTVIFIICVYIITWMWLLWKEKKYDGFHLIIKKKRY
jgi:hypothetical protein